MFPRGRTSFAQGAYRGLEVGRSNAERTPASELESGSTSSGGRACADQALALPVPRAKSGMLGAELDS